MSTPATQPAKSSATSISATTTTTAATSATAPTPTFRPSTPFSVYIPGTPTASSRPQTPVLTAATDPTEVAAPSVNNVQSYNKDMSSMTGTQDKQAAKEYLEKNLPPETKGEISVSQERVERSQQETFTQTQTSSEKIMSLQESSLQQEQVTGRPNFKTEEQSFDHVTAPAHVFKPAEQSGAFPFRCEDIPQAQDASTKTSQYSNTSVQYSNIYSQTEVTSQESEATYEPMPIKSLIQTFEQNSRPPMKYKQIQKDGTNIVMSTPTQHTRKPLSSQAPIVNGNVYYVASAHVETRQFAPQQTEITTQKVTGQETSDTQYQKFSSFSSSEQQQSLNIQHGQSSSIQTFQSNSLQSSTVNQQQLLTKITGKTAIFFVYMLIFFLQQDFWAYFEGCHFFVCLTNINFK